MYISVPREGTSVRMCECVCVCIQRSRPPATTGHEPTHRSVLATDPSSFTLYRSEVVSSPSPERSGRVRDSLCGGGFLIQPVCPSMHTARWVCGVLRYIEIRYEWYVPHEHQGRFSSLALPSASTSFLASSVPDPVWRTTWACLTSRMGSHDLMGQQMLLLRALVFFYWASTGIFRLSCLHGPVQWSSLPASAWMQALIRRAQRHWVLPAKAVTNDCRGVRKHTLDLSRREQSNLWRNLKSNSPYRDFWAILFLRDPDEGSGASSRCKLQ